jgi:hypothetical protein
MDAWFRARHGRFRFALGLAFAALALSWWREWDVAAVVLGIVVFILSTVVMVYLPRS